jgi:hypothetical protein
MAKRTVRTPQKRKGEWKPDFLKALAETGNVGASARLAGIGRTAVFRHRHNDPIFAEAWDDAIDEAADLLEAEAWRRAVKGTEKPVYQGGVLVGHIQEYDTTLLIFLLKGIRPEKYRDLNANQIADAITRRMGNSEPSPLYPQDQQRTGTG